METTIIKRKQGQQLTADEKADLLADLVEHMLKGFYSDNKLAQLCNVDRDTIRRYKGSASKIIASTRIDRNNIRALQIQRVYTRLEALNTELEDKKLTVKEKMAIHGQITKLEQHLALITGLNVETKVNVNQRKLVIVKAHPKAVEKARKEAQANQMIDVD